MSAARGASTVANAARGELGTPGRGSSLTDDRCTLVADDQRTTRMMWWTTPAPGITQQWGAIE